MPEICTVLRIYTEKEPLHVSEPTRGPSSFSCSNLNNSRDQVGLDLKERAICVHYCQCWYWSSVSGSQRPRGTYHGPLLFSPLNTYSGPMRFVILGGYCKNVVYKLFGSSDVSRVVERTMARSYLRLSVGVTVVPRRRTTTDVHANTTAYSSVTFCFPYRRPEVANETASDAPWWTGSEEMLVCRFKNIQPHHDYSLHSVPLACQRSIMTSQSVCSQSIISFLKEKRIQWTLE